MSTVLGYWCLKQSMSLLTAPLLSPTLSLVTKKPLLWVPPPQLVLHSHWCCLPLQDDFWGHGWSVPCLALPPAPFDPGHEEDVGKGQAGHRGGHPEGHGVGGFVDVNPVPALSHL